MSVIKKSRQSTVEELMLAIERFLPMPERENEHEAVKSLTDAMQLLSKSTLGDDNFSRSIRSIIDSFEGDLELKVYTLKECDSSKSWTEADAMAVVSNRIYALARRLKH